MFLAFSVEGDNATVEEVEGDGDTGVVLYAVPIVRMSVDILKDHDRLFVALQKQVVIVGLDGHEGYIDICGLFYQHGLTAACLEIFTIAQPIDNSGWLSLINQSEIEASQLATYPVIVLSQRLVGIVGPRFVDNISLKAIVRRRLDAEASAMTNSAEPNECLL
jgi:hypothetical protein